MYKKLILKESLNSTNTLRYVVLGISHIATLQLYPAKASLANLLCPNLPPLTAKYLFLTVTEMVGERGGIQVAGLSKGKGTNSE